MYIHFYKINIFLPNKISMKYFALKISSIINNYKITNLDYLKKNTKFKFLIYIKGDLGMGKTFFCKHFLKSFGIKKYIKSPTYSIFQYYKVSSILFCHFDFYRLNKLKEFFEIGIQESIYENSLFLIEWPEKISNIFYTPDLSIEFNFKNRQTRNISIFSYSIRGHYCIKKFFKKYS